MSTPKPEWAKSDYPGYLELVESSGYEVLEFETTGSYQGDHEVLLADGERRGFLMIGYGSCSGCDALEAAYGYTDSPDWNRIVELAAGIRDDIHWADSAADLAAYLRADIEDPLKWYLHDDEIKAVLTAFISKLEER